MIEKLPTFSMSDAPYEVARQHESKINEIVDVVNKLLVAYPKLANDERKHLDQQHNS